MVMYVSECSRIVKDVGLWRFHRTHYTVGVREYDIVDINVHGSGSVRLVPQPNLTP